MTPLSGFLIFGAVGYLRLYVILGGDRSGAVVIYIIAKVL